jgi:hypothetical protein
MKGLTVWPTGPLMRERKGGEVGKVVAPPIPRRGGKSELHRAGWSLTATRGDPKESATERKPPPTGGKGERVR